MFVPHERPSQRQMWGACGLFAEVVSSEKTESHTDVSSQSACCWTRSPQQTLDIPLQQLAIRVSAPSPPSLAPANSTPTSSQTTLRRESKDPIPPSHSQPVDSKQKGCPHSANSANLSQISVRQYLEGYLSMRSDIALPRTLFLPEQDFFAVTSLLFCAAPPLLQPTSPFCIKLTNLTDTDSLVICVTNRQISTAHFFSQGKTCVLDSSNMPIEYTFLAKTNLFPVIFLHIPLCSRSTSFVRDRSKPICATALFVFHKQEADSPQLQAKMNAQLQSLLRLSNSCGSGTARFP